MATGKTRMVPMEPEVSGMRSTRHLILEEGPNGWVLRGKLLTSTGYFDAYRLLKRAVFGKLKKFRVPIYKVWGVPVSASGKRIEELEEETKQKAIEWLCGR